MSFVFGRNLLDRPIAPQNNQRNFCLEIGGKPASRRHLVSFRYPVEYTLTNCPIIWDHFKDHSKSKPNFSQLARDFSVDHWGKYIPNYRASGLASIHFINAARARHEQCRMGFA